MIEPFAEPQVAGAAETFTDNNGGSFTAKVCENVQPLASAIFNEYVPAHSEGLNAAFGPDGSHVKLTAPWALTGVLIAAPLQVPLQVALVVVTLASNAGGSVSVITASAVQPLASVAFTVYVVAQSPVGF